MKKMSRFLKNEKYIGILWSNERNTCHNVITVTDETNGINIWLIWKRLYRVTTHRDYSFVDRRARAGGRIRFYSLFATMQVSAYASPPACVSCSWNCNLIVYFSNELSRSIRFSEFLLETMDRLPYWSLLCRLLTTTFRASFIVLCLHVYIYRTLFHEYRKFR